MISGCDLSSSPSLTNEAQKYRPVGYSLILEPNLEPLNRLARELCPLPRLIRFRPDRPRSIRLELQILDIERHETHVEILLSCRNGLSLAFTDTDCWSNGHGNAKSTA